MVPRKKRVQKPAAGWVYLDNPKIVSPTPVSNAEQDDSALSSQFTKHYI